LKAGGSSSFNGSAKPIVNEPTDVSTGPGPSAMVSVAVDAETVTEAREPAEGTLPSVQGTIPALYAASGSENSIVTRSTFPLTSESNICRFTTVGAARSSGGVGLNCAVCPALSRTPAALAASETVNAPTAVSGAPAPSFSANVAVEPATATAVRVPPDGVFVSVHGVVPAVYGANGFENDATTRSISPLPLTSSICNDDSIGGSMIWIA